MPEGNKTKYGAMFQTQDLVLAPGQHTHRLRTPQTRRSTEWIANRLEPGHFITLKPDNTHASTPLTGRFCSNPHWLNTTPSFPSHLTSEPSRRTSLPRNQ